MSAGALPKSSLRPYQESDLESLAEIRFAAIEELTVDDYDKAQRPASAADDDEVFAQTLEKGLKSN
jgi:putative acetyltransferase